MGVGTINVGANTSHFNEGIIVSGSALNATSTDDTLIASGTIEIITVKDPQLKLSYDASNNVQFTVDASGDLTITPSAATGDKNIYIKGDLIIRDNDESKHLVQIYDSSDDGVIAGYANNSITTLIHANGRTYFNGGNLGIGTSTPDHPFHIYANTGSYAALIDNDENSAGHGLKVTSDGSGTGTYLFDCESGSTTVFRVRSDGKVAIGETSEGGIPTQVEALTVNGDLSFRDYLKRRGDSDTYIGMPANNQMELVAGGVEFVAITRTAAGTGSFTINDSADDVNFTVESPSESKALYLHAGNEVFHINHGESSFKTKIHNTNGEAVTVNDSGTTINDDGHANIDFRVETDNFAGAILVDGGTDQVILCSNSTAASAESAGSDTNLFISGAIDGKENATGVTVVGGDIVISGSLYVSKPGAGRDVIFYGEDSSAQGLLWDADYAEHGGLILGQNNHGVDFIAYGETASRYIYWDQSNNRFNTAGEMMHTNGDVSFNDAGGSYDFRVESVANANMLFVDGGNSNVGIGTNSPNSVLHVNGPIAKPILTKTSAYTLTDSDSTILIDASGGVVTVTLPAASGLSGRIYTIKCIDSTSSATIASDSTELIDGSSSNISLSQWDSYTLQCNGTSWFKIGYVQGPPP